MSPHPEKCPKCGKLTRNWYYLSVRIYLECEHCRFQGEVSNTPTGGAQAYRGV